MYAALGLLGWVVLCFGAAGVGARFTTAALPGWYRQLDKPSWTPPDRVFGPVWSALYLAMAIAAWLVWRQRDAARAIPLSLFVLQLSLNVAWSAVFFGLRQTGLGVAVIVALWASIAATVKAFLELRPLAGWLLLPYLAWVSFASALNFAIWRRNP